MENKSKEMLIQEAIVFVEKNIYSNFRGDSNHEAKVFTGGRIEVYLYKHDKVSYTVTLFLDGRQPTVLRKELIQTFKMDRL